MADMKKVGIAIDEWKQQIFEETLTAHGYQYEVNEGLTHDTLMIKVMVKPDMIKEIQQVISEAQNACRGARHD